MAAMPEKRIAAVRATTRLAGVSELHDLSCVVHLHSTHSDGTGTVPEIARAAERAGADVVLLTDHDTLAARRRGEEGYHGPVLVLVGHEVSPPDRNHMLAFDTDVEIDHRGLTPPQIAQAVRDAGGFGIAAHPFSVGSKRFRRVRSLGVAMAWEDLDCLDGIEVWSFLSDNGENVSSLRDAIRFVAAPGALRDASAAGKPGRVGPHLRAPPGGGRRRPRRPPVRLADRRARDSPDGLRTLVSPAADPRPDR